MKIQELDQQYIAKTYKRFPVTIVSGSGSVAVDDTGKSYIDMGSGIGVTSFGYADTAWQAAVTEQIGRVQHTSNLYYTEPCARLAQMLCEKTGMRRVFFSNSGAEANECAIKAARKHAADTRGAEYNVIVTLENSFHGRTLTTLAATGQAHFHELFQPLTPGFVHVPAGDLDALKTVMAQHKVAAVMIECVQGEGGVVALDAEYVRALTELVHAQGALLIIDEVQTGNGRTGALYAYMNYGIAPDIVSTAKGLAGGLPLGATLLAESVQDVFSYGDHGSTFGGNPVSCAAACSILSRIDDALLAEVREKGEFLRRTFTGAPGIEAVSGMGLMLGLKTTRPAADVVNDCIAQGVLCLTAKDRVRLLPALNIPQEQLAQAAKVILDCCRG
ncbi:MAG: acetylornithine/succinylornithine family transaminase [Oscillospiraceae bacterium]|nr:acetylornithine/succinylornithine family transaminase [Oscillospiraceae bacterium]MCD7786988.1 acetylornithine/succinylornithine family transaminase [Oscillospiraceae bacterium]MCD7902386.1 acetylornithine/succinylornithine family transaminase [Oscillospiraceae bacterium]MCD8255748.1 acetylornithine/succinylornithine family transaminase [Oscillospiraceae bacterium]